MGLDLGLAMLKFLGKFPVKATTPACVTIKVKEPLGFFSVLCDTNTAIWLVGTDRVYAVCMQRMLIFLTEKARHTRCEKRSKPTSWTAAWS